MRINNLYLHIEMGSSSSKVTPVRQESENRSSDDQNRVTRSLSNRIKELERQLKLKDETSLKVQEKLSAAERQVKYIAISSNSYIISCPPPSQVDALTTEVSQLQDCLDAIKTNPCKSCSALEHMVSKLEGELSLAKNGLEEMVQSYRSLTHTLCTCGASMSVGVESREASSESSIIICQVTS